MVVLPLLNDMSKTSLRSVLIGVFRNKHEVLQHECIFVVVIYWSPPHSQMTVFNFFPLEQITNFFVMI